ncbi:MAG: hypothetical protein RIT81_18240 [Deltaproteobacteria bacterium]
MRRRDLDPAGLQADATLFDTAAGPTLRIPVVYENTTSSAVTPQAFDFRWACLDDGKANASGRALHFVRIWRRDA